MSDFHPISTHNDQELESIESEDNVQQFSSLGPLDQAELKAWIQSLPPLSDGPPESSHPDCQLSISSTLLRTLTSILLPTTDDQHTHTNKPKDSSTRLVLSVGSGRGLLEAYLQAHWSSIADCPLRVHGVEVSSSSLAQSSSEFNKWLLPQLRSTVIGTFQVSPLVQHAQALLFVYPREPKLIMKYFEEARRRNAGSLSAVVWLGPKCDWEYFGPSLRDVFGFEEVDIVEACGLPEYEMMAVVRKKGNSRPGQRKGV